MALQKSKELTSGVSGDYWKLLIKELSGSKTICAVSLYKDAAARAADKSVLESVVYSWSGEDNPCTIAAMDVADSNPIKLCYAKLKTLAEFSGAQDV